MSETYFPAHASLPIDRIDELAWCAIPQRWNHWAEIAHSRRGVGAEKFCSDMRCGSVCRFGYQVRKS